MLQPTFNQPATAGRLQACGPGQLASTNQTHDGVLEAARNPNCLKLAEYFKIVMVLQQRGINLCQSIEAINIEARSEWVAYFVATGHTVRFVITPGRTKIMKTFLIAIVLVTAGMPLAHAADTTCESQAAEKKLAGAAKTSFMKKCEKDSKAAGAADQCAAQAAEKKLAGAAKNSFVQKCVKDASHQ